MNAPFLSCPSGDGTQLLKMRHWGALLNPPPAPLRLIFPVRRVSISSRSPEAASGPALGMGPAWATVFLGALAGRACSVWRGEQPGHTVSFSLEAGGWLGLREEAGGPCLPTQASGSSSSAAPTGLGRRGIGLPDVPWGLRAARGGWGTGSVPSRRHRCLSLRCPASPEEVHRKGQVGQTGAGPVVPQRLHRQSGCGRGLHMHAVSALRDTVSETALC